MFYNGTQWPQINDQSKTNNFCMPPCQLWPPGIVHLLGGHFTIALFSRSLCYIYLSYLLKISPRNTFLMGQLHFLRCFVLFYNQFSQCSIACHTFSHLFSAFKNILIPPSLIMYMLVVICTGLSVVLFILGSWI